MSKIFFDHLVELDKIERKIKKIAQTPEEREEIFHLIDEIIHHRVIGCILDRLPESEHRRFSKKLVERPFDDRIISYLQKKISEDVEEFIKKEIADIKDELFL
ncbi:MAG: hypothetical protein UV74_C0013G0471 [Candidatus Woesebacteria bacterium GW2011_GWB1_43_14]|uniref:Uncharacterized protein n=1 Tax=Candidatus Woesebacteria bacterium GW2011_GWB1_43_14 TaxID=1618578 RepID=A0A0G1DI49_9BACT|nr:MAG: hypothetical protein UT21_C0001G0183 [Candidatus Woesebacteria bacterium GW2011_GWA1_39_11b]KKS78071.1 MAG: hypothetical protein UV51_C0003G0106 [Candidatus Woesebacteria bacterium GW2011_GWC1_42_9]KKS97349.1 MAG: hypothetical protein UV74_C0013G0471 [Candidatus Woesebacteria bacterium GW2011_GWB1_43_14]